MTPQSSRPEDVFRRDTEPGRWRCALCEVPAWMKGGDRAASRHYMSVHWRADGRYPGPKPAGFVPLPRPDQQEAS